MKKHEKHIEMSDLKGVTHLEVSVSYSKGGVNLFSGAYSPRGYYVTVRPVTKANGMVSFTMFSGRSKFLLGAKRFSQKQLATAVQMAADVEQELIDAVISEEKAA